MNFTKICWWWQWWWREAYAQESITILGVDINNKSIQDLEFSKMCVDSVIICNEPNFEVRSSILEPSKLVLSIWHRCFNFALKLQIIIVRNGLQLDNKSRFSSRFDLNIWISSCVGVGVVYRFIKWQISPAMQASKLMHSFRFGIFSTYKGSVAL